jgi:hypothetical protein
MASRGSENWRGALGLGIVAVGLAVAELASFGHHAVVCTGDLVADNTPLDGRELSLPTVATPKLVSSSEDESSNILGEGDISGFRTYDLGPLRMVSAHSRWWKPGYPTYERITIDDPATCTPRPFVLYDAQTGNGEAGTTASGSAVLRRDDSRNAWIVTTEWDNTKGQLVLRRAPKTFPRPPVAFAIGLVLLLLAAFSLRRAARYFRSGGIATWAEGTLRDGGDIEPLGTTDRVRAPPVGAPPGSEVLYGGVLNVDPTYRVAGGPVATMVVIGSHDAWLALAKTSARLASIFLAIACVVFAALVWQ